MLRCAAEREWKWVDFCCCCLGDSVVSVFVSDSISLIITLIKLFGSQPAWYNSVCKYKRFWMFSALSRNVLINRKPCTCNSPVPPPLFSIPTSKRKRTGSPHRSRSVDSASDTDVWPLSTLFGVPWPSTASSHAFVSNCIARIRDRMPWPVAEAANGNKPTVDVPRRKQASGHRVQHTNRHCLQSKNKKQNEKIWTTFGHIINIITKLYLQTGQFIDQRTAMVNLGKLCGRRWWIRLLAQLNRTQCLQQNCDTIQRQRD